jgi:hypothetical protein
MGKKLYIFSLIALMVTLSSCNDSKSFIAKYSKGNDYNLFEIQNVDKGTDVSFKDVIDYFNAHGESNIVFSGTFIATFDNKELTGNQFVAIYTNDPKTYNLEWGTYILEGITYGSSIFGATDLKVSSSFNYLLAISTY